MVVNAKEIKNLKSGIYSAVDEDGRDTVIMRQEGLGWSISKETHDGWYETIDFSEDGEIECVMYGK